MSPDGFLYWTSFKSKNNPVVGMQEADDFFGIQQISRTAIPPEFISGSGATQSRSKTAAETNFIDETFFPSLTEEEDGPKESRKADTPPRTKWRVKGNDEPSDDFFTEAIKNNKEEGFFANSSSEITHQEVEFMIQQLKAPSKGGLAVIQHMIDPVWRFSHEELLSFMERRVIYHTEDVIAFDKPYQMAFSGASASQAQLDRLIDDLKRRLAPDAECFRPVSRLEKFSTGVVIFAKTLEKAEKLRKLIDEGYGLFAYRALVKNVPAQERSRVNLTLIKVEKKGGDHKLCPLTGTAARNERLYHETTDVRVVNENREAHVALVDAFCKRSLANVIRSHLYYGLNCPVVGDRKYMKHEKEFKSTFAQLPRLSSAAVEALQLRKPNDVRQLPLFFHLTEVHIPENAEGRFSIVRAKMPAFFKFALKRLHLLRK